jgi:microcystin-dependent protein
MGEPFLGEVRAFPFGFAPQGWAPCQGQLLPINQNQALYSLLGNSYGGDPSRNFALPRIAPVQSPGGATLNYCMSMRGQYPMRSS